MRISQRMAPFSSLTLTLSYLAGVESIFHIMAKLPVGYSLTLSQHFPEFTGKVG